VNGCERCGVHVSNGEAWYAHSPTGDLIRVCGECWEKVKKPIPEATSLSQRTRIAKAKPVAHDRWSFLDTKGVSPLLWGCGIFLFSYPRFSLGIIGGLLLFSYGVACLVREWENGHNR
jgi:hypothetical protein